MATSSGSERQRLVDEVQRLHGLMGDLDREWRQLRRLLFGNLAAIPALVVWGPIAAALVVLGVTSIVITAAYLIGVHRREYQGELLDVRRRIAVLDRRAPDAKATRT